MEQGMGAGGRRRTAANRNVKVSNRQIGDHISWALMFVVILGRTRLPGYDIADILRW